ncbi:MAG: ATP-binding cassette domain-containing protein [Halobacteriaceae archaeon]
MSGETGLVVEDLRKRYEGVTALAGVSLEVPDGAVHALAGPNGSGKTTLLAALAGLVTPTSGTIRRPPGAVGVGFQEPNVYPSLSVRENLAVFGAMVDAEPSWRASLAERLRLRPVMDREVGALSDGYRKKLDLALATLRKPPLLLFDEPLADLDDLTSRRLVELVEELATSGRVIVVSTHDVDAFATPLDGLTVLYDGRVISAATGDALERPGETYRAAVDGLTDRPSE